MLEAACDSTGRGAAECNSIHPHHPQLRQQATRSAPNPAQTRARILDRARQLIATRGYPATTLQAIAIESDVSPTALHHYFASLGAIYQALMVEASAVVMRCTTMAGMESTLPDQLAAYIAEFGRSSVSDHATVTVLVGSRLAASQIPAPADDLVVDVRAFLTQAVRDSIDRGELPVATRVPVLVDLLYSML